MPETSQQPVAQAPARPATAADAENARLDARIELAAKKAALQSLEAQTGGPPSEAAPVAPPPPGMRQSKIIIEQDGKTTVLENPTAEQLAQAGIGAPSRSGPDPTLVITTMSFAAVLLVIWMVLRHLRGGRAPVAPRESAEAQARMARIENAIESVAVEVERISENQRYVTRALAEGAAPLMAPHVGEFADAATTNRRGA